MAEEEAKILAPKPEDEVVQRVLNIIAFLEEDIVEADLNPPSEDQLAFVFQTLEEIMGMTSDESYRDLYHFLNRVQISERLTTKLARSLAVHRIRLLRKR